MTEDKIPVPAESVRQVALSAAEDIPRLREEGLKATAQYRQRAISEVLEATAGHDGEFVAIDSSTLADVAAGSDIFDHHKDAVRTFLHKYGVWG